MNYKRINDFKNKDGDEYTSAVMIESGDFSREYQEDYLLPDYLPDAKKVLKFVCKPVIESAFMGNSTLEFTGSVFMKVLYLSEQSKLCSAGFSMSFEDKISNENITDDCVDLLLPKVYSASCRLQNPRKFNVRIKCGGEAEIWKRVSYLPEVYGGQSRDDMASVQTNPVLTEGMWVLSVKEDEMSFSEDIPLDKSMADIEEIIFSSSDITFDECRGGNNEIICKGSLDVRILYRGTDGMDYYLKKSLPVSANLNASGLGDESCPIVYAFEKPLDINVIEDEFGARRIFGIEMDYTIQAECFSKKEMYLTTDGYSTEKDWVNNYHVRDIYSKGQKVNGGFSVNEGIGLDDIGISSADKIVYYSCTPKLNVSSEGGKKERMIFEGECEMELIMAKKDGNVYPVSFRIPIKYESEKPFADKNGLICKCNAKATGVRLRTDESKVYVDMEIGFCAVSVEKNSRQLLESMRLVPSSSKKEQTGGCVVLCYPSKDDDIWSVAKKYRVRREDIASVNKISDEMPKVVRIPR